MLKVANPELKGFTMKVMRDGRPVTVEVTSDGAGLISHAGTALVAQVADTVGLTNALSVGLAAIKQRRRGHDPGRVIRDLAVMLVDGGECVADLGAVREQDALFGTVASDSTAFRMVDRIASTPGLLDAVRVAYARARARFWELHGAPERLTLDVDATLITAHSEKEKGGRELQGRLRLPPLAGLPRSDQGGARRSAQARERRVKHRRGSQNGDQPGTRADPSRIRRELGDPCPC